MSESREDRTPEPGETPPEQVLPRRLERVAVLALSGLLLLFAATSLAEVYRNHKWKPEVDFRAYRAASLAAGRGGDLYGFHRAGDAHLRTTPYNYPPTFACLIHPLARLPLAVGFYLWCGLMLLTLGGVVLLIHRSVRELGVGRPALLAGAPLLLSPFLLDSNLYWGQVNVLVTLLVAAVVLSELRGRSVAAGSLLAVATAVKVLPVLLLVWFLLRRDLRAVLGFLGTTVVALLVLPALVGGPRWAWDMNVAWASMLWSSVTEGRSALPHYYDSISNGSLSAVLDRLFGGGTNKPLIASLSQARIDAVGTVVRATLVMASFAVAARAALFGRRALRPRLWVLVAALLLTTGWLVNYLLWDHHLVGLLLLLPLVTAVGLDPRLGVRWRQPLVVCVIAGVLVLSSGFFPGSRRWGVQTLCLLVLWGGLFWALLTAHRALPAPGRDAAQRPGPVADGEPPPAG